MKIPVTGGTGNAGGAVKEVLKPGAPERRKMGKLSYAIFNARSAQLLKPLVYD